MRVGLAKVVPTQLHISLNLRTCEDVKVNRIDGNIKARANEKVINTLLVDWMFKCIAFAVVQDRW